MRLIAKGNVNINGVFYNDGDEITGIKTKEQVIKLNEIGYIYPLSMKDIQDFGKEENKPKIMNKKNEKEE